MAITSKHRFYIDSSTFSGSTEELRNELGINWRTAVSTNSDGTENFTIAFQSSDEAYLLYPDATTPESWLDQTATNTSTGEKLKYVELQPVLQELASTEVIVPNYKVPGRFYGNGEEILSDTDWKTYLLGGTFGETNYPGIYSEGTYDYYGFQYELPYTPAEVEQFETIEQNSHEAGSIKYYYNQYVPTFESWAHGQDNLNEIPSIALMEVYNSLSGSRLSIAENLITRDGTTMDVAAILSPTEVPDLPPRNAADVGYLAPTTAGKYMDITKNLREYLGQEVPLNGLSAQTKTDSLKLRNLIYNREGTKDLLRRFHTGGDQEKVLDSWPYYVKLDLPRAPDDGENIRDAIDLGNCSSYLLYLFKNHFGSGRSTEKTFTVFEQKNGVVDNDLSVETAIGDESVANADLLQMLVRAYESDQPPEDDCFIIGDDFRSSVTTAGEEVNSISKNSRGTHRFLSSYSLLTTLTRLASFLDHDHDPFTDKDGKNMFYVDENLAGKNGIYELLNRGQRDNYSETIAYRIEKTVVPTITDFMMTERTTVQDIWIYNGTDTSADVRYVDSQVQYGETYTYTVYAYVVCAGVKYRMGDLRIGKNIGIEKGTIITNPNLPTTPDQYCIQFHNPTTDAIEDQLFSTTITYDWLSQNILPYQVGRQALSDDPDLTFDLDGDGDVDIFDVVQAASDTDYLAYESNTGVYHGLNNPLSADNTFSSDAQTRSTIPYLADFNLYYEPTLQVFEVPIMSNTVTILDNPADPIDVTAFQKIDNSQEIGFLIKKETHEPSAPFPIVITRADEEYKTNYLASKNLSDSSGIEQESASPQVTLQVYRMPSKPTSYADFDPFLYKTLSLKIEGTENYMSSHIFYDKIRTNEKYYYVFRLLNAHQEPGPPSPIIEAELVDDGGYKYSIFTDLFPQDLKEEVFSNPSIPFKKLVQIVPHINQLQFNVDNVDFNDTAANQLANVSLGSTALEQSIFSDEYPRFKIRLTSKKTGKKIDLNLRFNLSDEL